MAEEPADPTPPPPAEEIGPGFDFADPHSPLAPCYLHRRQLAAVAVLLPLAVLFVLFTIAPVWHTDVWGHLRFGEDIIEQRKLPERETFSGDFADQQAPYVNFQWLAQAAFYQVFDFGRRLAAPDPEHALGGGALLLSTFHALVVTLRLAVLLLAFHRLTGSWGFALLGVGLVAGMSVFSHLFILRPQILGELCFALVLLALSRPVLSRWAVLGLPVVFVFWTNSHGSYLVGLTVVGLALIGESVAAARRRRSTRAEAPPGFETDPLLTALGRDPAVLRLGMALALSLAASALLNPHGPALLQHSWQLAGHPNIRTMEEWKPLPLTSPAGVAYLLSFLAVLALLAVRRGFFSPTQLLLILALGWQPLLSARMLIWWIMLFAWIVVPHLHALYRRHVPAAPENGPNLRRTILAAMMGGVAVLLLLCSAPAQWLLFGRAPLGSQRVSPLTPVREAQYLREQYRRDSGGTLPRRIFASETLGDYLLWELRLEPPVRLCCYTHVHLLQPAHWQDCIRVKSGDPQWEAILERWQVQYIVLEHDRYQKDGGYSDLIDKVKAAPDRWQVEQEKPIFVARRRMRNP